MEAGGTTGIIALVPDDWDYVVTLRHQVMQRLAKYYPVVWVEPARNWREFLNRKGLGSVMDRWAQPVPGMDVLTPGARHPLFYKPTWLADATLRSRLTAARNRLRARGAKRIALYLWRDAYADALDLVQHDFSCYHIDDDYRFSDKESPTSRRELDLLRQVDQVIIHSPALFEKKGSVNPKTALIPNGVDFPLFSTPHAEPADIASIPHPRIGYAGVIKRQLDLGLLLRLARLRPDWSFVMVGPVMNVEGKQQELEGLRQLANVYLLGGKPAHELPAYIQHFDVGLMCYELNDYTRYIYPLKLHEYLASGRPAVSAPISAVLRFTNVVTVAKDDAEWLAAIESALAERDPEGTAIRARQEVARKSDWEVLVGQIARLFAYAS